MSTADDFTSGKRAGKTEWAGRRRPMTRRAGYSSHPDVTGGEFRTSVAGGYRLPPGTSIEIEFGFPTTPAGTILGFGGWYLAPDHCEAHLEDFAHKAVLTPPSAPDWSKFGSQWCSDGESSEQFRFIIESGEAEAMVALWAVEAGAVEHRYLTEATETRPNLMKNMHAIAPEANFYAASVETSIEIRVSAGVEPVEDVGEIVLKACNRCARFLPINIHNERHHLSFANHCVAERRRPCTHSSFGQLRHIETGEVMQLEYGFQLECRFCKKFEVNAALNPQRTAGQMKEDAARRRAFELLLTELYEGSPSLLYRHETGHELADEVWKRFGGQCFKCKTPLATAQDMHIDHTRPLALLWPLDGTATALCPTCNSSKRDMPPAAFYTASELDTLSQLTGIELEELKQPHANADAIDRLLSRLDWFFDVFLERPELQTTHEGKLAADLLIKALQKALDRYPGGAPIDIVAENEERRGEIPEDVTDETELLE